MRRGKEILSWTLMDFSAAAIDGAAAPAVKKHKAEVGERQVRPNLPTPLFPLPNP